MSCFFLFPVPAHIPYDVGTSEYAAMYKDYPFDEANSATSAASIRQKHELEAPPPLNLFSSNVAARTDAFADTREKSLYAADYRNFGADHETQSAAGKHTQARHEPPPSFAWQQQGNGAQAQQKAQPPPLPSSSATQNVNSGTTAVSRRSLKDAESEYVAKYHWPTASQVSELVVRTAREKKWCLVMYGNVLCSIAVIY